MKILALPLIMLASLTILADVVLDSTVTEVYYRGNPVIAGSITLRPDGDDFDFATEAEPVYIRITPDRNSRLAETRVDLNSDEASIQKPIYLALSLHSSDPNARLNASANAVSIVRWVAGERDIWLSVQESSSQWININGALSPPDENHRVAFSIGVSAKDSHLANQPGSLTNLSFNTRNLSASERDGKEAVSTLLSFDLSNGNLIADDTANAILAFDIIAFDHEANYEPGLFSSFHANTTPINFSGDYIIARGVTTQCEVESVKLNDHTLTITPNDDDCITTVDIYTRDLYGNYFLVAEGVAISGTTDYSLENLQPRVFYGTVPAGETPDVDNFVATAVVSVPTLSEWGLIALITLMLSTAIYIRRR